MKNKKMKIARIECDMKQDDLAKAVGVTRQTIGLIESGNYNPTLKLCMIWRYKLSFILFKQKKTG